MNKVDRFKKLTATMDIPKERREPTKANLGNADPTIANAWQI